ncbi:hypothetical protein [Xanthomonas sp. MUS 060]|uniref:hypothetical protein n=1 Tax=Xanthomonas sp. MUS 060 TaxID=1588031 RepID=UPI0005F28095|nr:hypothetical protein [Xanthomonas sp. MUS 060]
MRALYAQTKANLEPYSSPNSPLRALYAQTKANLEKKGISMSEERLHQVVGEMALYKQNEPRRG